jgi:hypothetical protein
MGLRWCNISVTLHRVYWLMHCVTTHSCMAFAVAGSGFGMSRGAKGGRGGVLERNQIIVLAGDLNRVAVRGSVSLWKHAEVLGREGVDHGEGERWMCCGRLR